MGGMYNGGTEMKKKLLVPLTLFGLVLLSSCQVPVPFFPVSLIPDDDESKVELFNNYTKIEDNTYQFRFLLLAKENAIHIDEYYYSGSDYSGNITIDIDIPDSINGIPITMLGRDEHQCNKNYIIDGSSLYHDKWYNTKFSIITREYFADDANISININLGSNIENIDLGFYSLCLYNNSSKKDEYFKEKIYRNVKVSFSLSNENKNFYIYKGDIYSKKTNKVVQLELDVIKGNPNIQEK